MNTEYARKTAVAAEMAYAAFARDGIEGMHADLSNLRGLDADPVILAEYERRYHNAVKAGAQ